MLDDIAQVYVAKIPGCTKPPYQLIMTDNEHAILPERTHVLAIEACGGLAVKATSVFSPGHRVVQMPSEGMHAVKDCPQYHILCRIPEAVVREAKRRTDGNLTLFTNHMHMFWESP